MGKMRAMKRLLYIPISLSLALLAMGTTLAQSNVSVVIDGSPMAFYDQPPVDQSGRIFVPMRAIFQRLGATVVYSNGTINATRGHRTISLAIGSQSATVDGQPVQLDSPPFLIGDRTLVPLRFVSQALGSQVSWDESRMTAFINTNGMGGYQRGYQPGYQQNEPPPQPGYQPGYQPSYQQYQQYGPDAYHPVIVDLHPMGQDPYVYSAIGASFRTRLDPSTVRVSLDGSDVTQDVQIRPNGFQLSTPYRLRPGRHLVHISGIDVHGNRITDSYSFTVSH
jgi:hypothetical protein